jgi:hypothetical protein
MTNIQTRADSLSGDEADQKQASSQKAQKPKIKLTMQRFLNPRLISPVK